MIKKGGYLNGAMFWLYKRDFDAIGGFDESLISLEDMDFAIRLKKLGAVSFSVYAENASSIMSAKAGSTSIENIDKPFISIDDKTNDITFDESQIYVDIDIVEPSYSISKEENDLIIEYSNDNITGQFKGVNLIERISLEIEAKNTSEDELQKAKMDFYSHKLKVGE